MKLVISYTVGDGCTYSCDVNDCVEYESAEAFFVHLDEKAQAYMAAVKKNTEDYDAYRKRVEPLQHELRRAKKEPARQRIEEEIAKLPNPLLAVDRSAHEVKLGNLTLDLDNFIHKGVFYPPEVQTLEEWWQAKVDGNR